MNFKQQTIDSKNTSSTAKKSRTNSNQLNPNDILISSGPQQRTLRSNSRSTSPTNQKSLKNCTKSEQIQKSFKNNDNNQYNLKNNTFEKNQGDQLKEDLLMLKNSRTKANKFVRNNPMQMQNQQKPGIKITDFDTENDKKQKNDKNNYTIHKSHKQSEQLEDDIENVDDTNHKYKSNNIPFNLKEQQQKLIQMNSGKKHKNLFVNKLISNNNSNENSNQNSGLLSLLDPSQQNSYYLPNKNDNQNGNNGHNKISTNFKNDVSKKKERSPSPSPMKIEPEIKFLNETFQAVQTIREKTKVLWILNLKNLQKPQVKSIKTQWEEKFDIKVQKLIVESGELCVQVELIPDFQKEIQELKEKIELQKKLQKEEQLIQIKKNGDQNIINLENSSEEIKDEDDNQQNKIISEDIFNLDDYKIARKSNIQMRIFYYDNQGKIQDNKREQKLITFVRGREDDTQIFEIGPNIYEKGQIIIQANIGYVQNSYDKPRNQIGYVGIKNEGNTCYMNSFLQTLYHLKPFRKLIYNTQTKNYQGIIGTLQKFFFDLSSSRNSISTSQLMQSFGWDPKQAQYQQDVSEFQCLFFESIENATMKSQDLKKQFHTLFTGKQQSYIKCIKVDYNSTNEEEFLDIKLNIKGFNDINESFQDYILEEKLDGPNQYDSGKLGKQDAVKGVKFIRFPDVLYLHLKRFEYDYQNDKNIKIMEKWKYYDEIDLQDYVVPDNQEDNKFVLLSVLVHQGKKAGMGHYYVLIRPDGPGTRWIKFNDQSLEKISEFQVFDMNFGGHIINRNFDKDKIELVEERNQFNSTAYMLVYIRKEKLAQFLEPVTNIPRWIIEQKQDEQKQKEENDIKQKYVDLRISFVSLLKQQKQSQTGYFFNRITQNYELPDDFFQKNSISFQILKETKLSDLFQQIAEKLNVKKDLLAFYLITYIKHNKQETVRNLNLGLMEETYNKNIGTYFDSTKQNVLLVIPLNKSLKIEAKFNEVSQICELKKQTDELFTSNPILEQIFEDISTKQRKLIYVKIFNLSKKDSPQKLSFFDYFFVKTDLTFEEFYGDLLQENPKLQNYDINCYSESKYQVTKIPDEQFQKKISEIFSKVIYAGILILELKQKSTQQFQIQPNQLTLEGLFQLYSNSYQITIINGKTGGRQDINLNADDDLQHIIQRIFQEKILDKSVDQKKVYIKAKQDKSNKFKEVQFYNSENETKLKDIIQYSKELVVDYDDLIEAKDREKSQVYEIVYQYNNTNIRTQTHKLVGPKAKDILVSELIQIIQNQNIFEQDINKNIEMLIQNDENINGYNIEIEEDSIQENFEPILIKTLNQDFIQICLSDRKIQQYYKNQFILTFMMVPKYNQNTIHIFGEHTTKNQEQQFDLNFYLQIPDKKVTLQEIEKLIFKHLKDVQLHLNDNIITIKNNPYNSQNLNTNKDINNIKTIKNEKKSNVRFKLNSNYKRDEDQVLIDPKSKQYIQCLKYVYPFEDSIIKELYLTVEHYDLSSKDNIMKMANN